MANYATLKAAVQSVVKSNGNKEITGPNMQSTLISIINELGAGYQFMGVATPSTSPGTPDYNVAYIGGSGTYTNFGTSTTIPVGSVGVFKYNGSWSSSVIDVSGSVIPLTGFYNCSTGSTTAAKTVSATGYQLTNGGAIKVQFTYTNTNASPTLNVNGTGAKTIIYNGAVADAINKWDAGDVVAFYYDPTYNSNAGAWVGMTAMIDAVPTESSKHLVESGGVALKTKPIVPIRTGEYGGIVDNTVSLSKLAFCVNGDNLFNPSKIVLGYYQNGKFHSSSSYSASDYIKVESNTTYYVNGYKMNNVYTNMRFVEENDGELNYIGDLSNVATSFTTGSTTQYVRISFTPSLLQQVYIGKVAYAQADAKYNPLISKEAIDYDFSAKDAELARVASIADELTIQKILLRTPAGFGWQNNPLIGKIYTDYRGNVYYDFDVSDYKYNGQPESYFVDFYNGNDSNAGTNRSVPLKTVTAALAKTDVKTIYIMEGIYNRRDLGSGSISKSVNIIGLGNVVIAGSASLGWTQYSGDVYVANTSNCTDIFDLGSKNEYGDYTRYVAKSSIADVEAEEGTYYLQSSTLYAHPINGDTSHLLRMVGDTCYEITGSCNVYFENITFIGATRAIYAHAEHSSETINFYAKNCKFINSRNHDYDTLMLQGTTLSILQGCECSYSRKDGFNYHERSGIVPNAIELNCIGKLNGTPGNSSDQGSTAHDGVKLIRIGGCYFGNNGSNTAEEGTDTESWNVNCVAFESASNYASQGMNFYSYGDTKVFLDSCIGFGSPYNIGGAGSIYTRNCKFSGTLEPEGNTYIEY